MEDPEENSYTDPEESSYLKNPSLTSQKDLGELIENYCNSKLDNSKAIKKNEKELKISREAARNDFDSHQDIDNNKVNELEKTKKTLESDQEKYKEDFIKSLFGNQQVTHADKLFEVIDKIFLPKIETFYQAKKSSTNKNIGDYEAQYKRKSVITRFFTQVFGIFGGSGKKKLDTAKSYNTFLSTFQQALSANQSNDCRSIYVEFLKQVLSTSLDNERKNPNHPIVKEMTSNKDLNSMRKNALQIVKEIRENDLKNSVKSNIKTVSQKHSNYRTTHVKKLQNQRKNQKKEQGQTF